MSLASRSSVFIVAERHNKNSQKPSQNKPHKTLFKGYKKTENPISSVVIRQTN